MPIDIDNPTYAEYQEIMAAGDFHPETTYQDYLALCQERLANREEARRLGYLDKYEEGPDLDAPFAPEELELIAKIFPDLKLRPQEQDLAA